MIPVGLLGKPPGHRVRQEALAAGMKKPRSARLWSWWAHTDLNRGAKELALLRRHGLLHERQQCIGCCYQLGQQRFIHMHITRLLSQIAAFVLEHKQAFLGLAQFQLLEG